MHARVYDDSALLGLRGMYNLGSRCDRGFSCESSLIAGLCAAASSAWSYKRSCTIPCYGTRCCIDEDAHCALTATTFWRTSTTAVNVRSEPSISWRLNRSWAFSGTRLSPSKQAESKSGEAKAQVSVLAWLRRSLTDQDRTGVPGLLHGCSVLAILFRADDAGHSAQAAAGRLALRGPPRRRVPLQFCLSFRAVEADSRDVLCCAVLCGACALCRVFAAGRARVLYVAARRNPPVVRRDE